MFRVIQKRLLIYPKRNNPNARPPIDKKFVVHFKKIKTPHRYDVENEKWISDVYIGKDTSKKK